jgi:hypothetical protein
MLRTVQAERGGIDDDGNDENRPGQLKRCILDKTAVGAGSDYHNFAR